MSSAAPGIAAPSTQPLRPIRRVGMSVVLLTLLSLAVLFVTVSWLQIEAKEGAL